MATPPVPLAQDIQALQQDLTATQQVAAQLATLAPAASQALALAQQFAAGLAAPAQQLTTLAASVHDNLSAAQAEQAAQPVLANCSALLSPLAPAEQTWSAISALAAQRNDRLAQRWQQLHTEPPFPGAVGMTDPLASALTAYAAATGQLDATMHAVVNFPAAPALAAVAAWLTACAQQLTSAQGTVTTATSDIGTTMPWAGLQAAAAAAATAAQDLLSAAQRVSAAVAGTTATVAADPAALTARLGDLTALRLAVCPDPITPADRAMYGDRMNELNMAFTGLLGAPAGVPATVPLVMPPVSIQVRSRPGANGGTDFRVRVYPDSFHVNAHDPRLTVDEAQWSQHLAAAAAANGGVLPQAEWAQAAELFGPARAAYLLRPDANAGTRPGPWAQPATATALPDRWLAIGYAPDGSPLAAALGQPIPAALQVPDPAQNVAPAAPGEPQVDPAVRWMIDFDEAVANGMGVVLTVDGGAAGTPPAPANSGGTTSLPPGTGPATLSRLVVVGVRAAEATAALAALLDAHHYTDGLGLIGYGTPTNNTPAGPSGYTAADPGHTSSYTAEVLRPAATGDAARLAAVLGVPPSVFAAAAAAPLTEQQDQQAMTALAWQATWGGFLTGLAGMSAARAEQLRSWAAAWLRPAGPLTALRVGTRPYGLLPVVDLAKWADPGDPAAADVHSVVTGLVPAWLAADPAAAGLDFDALLARTPLTAAAWARFSGIMPGWLQDDYGLGVSYAGLQAAIGALPGQLALLGPPAGLGARLAWPGGFVTLPDPVAPVSPWPLVNGDGSAFPFSTALAPAVPAGYLGALLSGTQPPQPAALLDFIARQSWSGTSGMPGGQWTFGPRGNLGDAPEPPAPSAADELHASVAYLAGRPSADFDSLLGGALDATAHRLDAWHTALATRRLGQLRTAQPAQVYLGGFGWVENLVARAPLSPASVPGEPAALQDPANRGYQLAPSEQQAVTAAVLRSGFLTNNPSGAAGQPAGSGAGQGNPFAVDLSSRRARLATWLLDGVRQGQALADLLGYRFERTLQESGLGPLIEPFRQAFPYNPVITGNGGGETPAESAPVGGVTDGVALNNLAQSAGPGQQPASLPSPLTADDWTQAQRALAVLADAVDAVADAVTAQTLHDALTGNTHGAGATLDSVASGVVPPPPLPFLNTPRGGSAVTHRVLVPVPAGQPSPPPGWAATPRGSAEPALTSWLASLLGDPSQVTAAVTLTDGTGAAIGDVPVPVTLASLGLGPLDVAALAARPAELQDLAVHTVHTVLAAGAGSGAGGSTGATGGTLNASPAGAARPLAAVLAVAAAAGQVIGTGTAADARDLAPPATVTDPGVNLADLATRVNGNAGGPPGAAGQLTAAAAALAAALPGDPAPGPGTTPPSGVPAGADPAALAAALLQAMLLGVPAAAPAGTGAGALPTLVNQARAARAEIARRQAAVSALEPAAGAVPAAGLAARLAQLSSAFGAGFRALPVITTNPAGLITQAAALTATATADPGQGPDAWLVKASRVHQPVTDLLTACCAAEALGSGPPLAVTIAQLPAPQPAAPGSAATPAPWAGLPFTGDPPAASTLSLVMAAAAPPAGSFSALVVTTWDETIPGKQQIAGLTYHYDAPAAQAPQCVLLAVPAAAGTATWNYADLAATVTAAWQLAHIRGVDYADLPGAARVVLPAAYFADAHVAAPGPWAPALAAVNVPASYTIQTPGASEITNVTPGSVMQGRAVPLTVTGVSFAPPGTPPLTAQSFAVTAADGSPSGVSLTLNGTMSDTQAPLLASVDPQATPGPRNLTVGPFSLANCLTVVPRPLATGCDTAQLAQQIRRSVTQVITVTGQAFSSPVVTLTGSNLVGCQLTSATATLLTVTVTIAESTWSPGSPPLLARLRPDIPKNPVPPPYHPPRHVPVNLTLGVTPAPGAQANTFQIVLDSIW